MKDRTSDQGIRDLYVRNAPAVDSDEIWEGVKRRLPASAHQPETKHRPRQASGLRVALYASLALVIVAGAVVGGLQVAQHLGGGEPVLVITDDTTPSAQGSTGQALHEALPSEAAAMPSAAMSRGNAAQTGMYVSGGPSELPTLAWKFPMDVGASSPVIFGQVAYVTAGASLYAVDVTTGQQIWDFQGPAAVMGSPAVAGGLVYFAAAAVFDADPPTEQGYLYAVDATTGQEKWSFLTGGQISSPVVLGGVVYFSSRDGYLYAVDAATGEERWRFLIAEEVEDSPAVSGGMVYIASYDGYLYALDAATGEEEWRFQTGGYWVGAAAVSEGTVFVGAAHRGGAPPANDIGYLYAVDASTGDEEWSFQLDGAIPTAPAVSGEMVLFGSQWTGYNPDLEAAGYLYAVNVATGEEKWKFKPAGDGMGLIPSISGKVVYVESAADPWVTSPNEEIGPSYLYALDIATGEELWTYEVEDGEGIGGSPVISGGAVYFTTAAYWTTSSYLYELK